MHDCPNPKHLPCPRQCDFIGAHVGLPEHNHLVVCQSSACCLPAPAFRQEPGIEVPSRNISKQQDNPQQTEVIAHSAMRIPKRFARPARQRDCSCISLLDRHRRCVRLPAGAPRLISGFAGGAVAGLDRTVEPRACLVETRSDRRLIGSEDMKRGLG